MRIVIYCMFLLCFCSCDEKENIVKISGTFYNHINKNALNGKEVQFFNTMSGVTNNYLGSIVINSNGEFSFEYEINPLLYGPYLRMGFDTFFIASSKLEFYLFLKVGIKISILVTPPQYLLNFQMI